MKFNKWTVGLAALGVVSLASAARADETNAVMTTLSSTTISGYVDVSAQFNPNGGGGIPAVAGPPVVPAVPAAPNYNFGNKANGISLNVVDIALDKPEDATPWAAGYHVEFWVGPDGNTLGVGNDIRQAYILLRTPVGNGIDWKIGIFDTIIGYEGTSSGSNPNYSRSFGYNLEPTTHTGIVGTYKINDEVSIQAGVADTSYGGSGAYNAAANTTGLYLPTWLGAVTLTAPDNFGWAKGATLAFGVINSSGNTAQLGGTGVVSGNGDGATSYYVGATLPTPNANLKFGASFDYLNARDVSANAWDVALYSTFQISDKLSLNLRAEYLAGGYGAGTPGTPVNGGAYLTLTPPGTTDQQAQELTATVQYNLWANVLTRLEFRWDHVDNGLGYINNYSNLGSAATPQKNAFLLAAQAIYTF